MLKKIPLHWQIIIGLILGVAWGFASLFFELPSTFTIHWIKPFGTIFINLLKMISVPLVFASLIVGVTDLNNIQKLSRIGFKTVIIYLLTTVLALSIGLIAVNIIKPGNGISEEAKQKILLNSHEDVSSKIGNLKESAPLDALVNIFPTNIIEAAYSNQNTLQIVFLAIFMGIICIKLPTENTQTFVSFFKNLNQILIKMIDYILLIAPIGVFALISALIIEIKDPEFIFALFNYSVTVIIGLLVMLLMVYPTLLFFFSNINPITFYKNLKPALLLAFSTSSSNATLPVTIKQCEENLHIHPDVASFVLPLGATVNMDGTSLYQAVAAVFIAQVTGFHLSLGDQATIVLTALLASIGTAGVPGVGMIMLTIVLESVGLPVAYIALIMAPDRILDMCRTVVNVTGDATVASIINKSEGKELISN